MSQTIVPPSELLSRALHWLDEERSSRPDAQLPKLIEEASIRFDLSPAQEEWLLFIARKPIKS